MFVCVCLRVLCIDVLVRVFVCLCVSLFVCLFVCMDLCLCVSVFLPACCIESLSLKWLVSWGCGGDALRLQRLSGAILALFFKLFENPLNPQN